MTGLTIGLILLFFLIVEIVLLYILGSDDLSKPPTNVKGDKKVKQKGKWYVYTTLTFSGLVFTSITIIMTLSPRPERYADPIFLLGMSIALFLITYKLYFHTLTKLLYLYIMDKTNSYGFFSFILAIILIFDIYFVNKLLIIPMAASFVIIVILHFKELKDNIESLR